ncbi:hypothetical protein L1987_78349 [Smallanthus sonchifolius]|uniref:Uncharacterized protein n=1 Tax=Smallanthus sonchifolius TaxID=185202 RepID=A0ACB8ZCL6_9ASTR|nr:hypothetical protein L1987_78349 [Smallanthus sonchifolius]
MDEINARVQVQRDPTAPTQLYSCRGHKTITPVIVPTCEASIQMIISLPATTVQISTTSIHPIMTESILVSTTSAPTVLQTTTLHFTVMAGTLPPMTHSIEFGDMGHHFDLSDLFAEVVHETGEPSTTRVVDPRDERIAALESQVATQQTQINQLIESNTRLTNQWQAMEEQVKSFFEL